LNRLGIRRGFFVRGGLVVLVRGFVVLGALVVRGLVVRVVLALVVRVVFALVVRRVVVRTVVMRVVDGAHEPTGRKRVPDRSDFSEHFSPEHAEPVTITSSSVNFELP
jgi:hypothetical protein